MRVLVVDPDPAAAEELTAELLEAGLEAWASASHPAEALERAREGRPTVVVCMLSDGSEEALRRVAELVEARLARVSGLLFCGDDAEALEQARQTYPGASFTRRSAVHTAIASLRT